MVEIIESYRDYTPSFAARVGAEQLLATVPQRYLGGLGQIVLSNRAALTGHRRRARTKSRGKRLRLTEAAGLYHARSRTAPAWIEVFVDQVTVGVPAWALRFRLVRNMTLGMVLYHELGHHIHAQHRPKHREKEDVADDWSDDLLHTYVRSAHPISRALLSPVARIVTMLRGSR